VQTSYTKITIEPTEKAFWENNTQAYVFFMRDNLKPVSCDAMLEKVTQDFYPDLISDLEDYDFTGKAGQLCMLTAPSKEDKRPLGLIFIGLGGFKSKAHITLEVLRRAIGDLVLKLKKHKISSAVMQLPESDLYEISTQELLKQTVTIAHMADYKFSLAKKEQSKKQCEVKLLIDTCEYDGENIEEGFCEGNIIGQGINNARTWADTPPNIMTPQRLSEEAQIIAQEHNLVCTIFGRQKARELGMGAFLAVDAGSRQECRFVVLEYIPETSAQKTIALLGKGVMFDSGGLSLKTAAGMTGMKYDMCAAAAVIATMKIIAQLKPNVRVVGITALAENMPDGNAARQDDVVTAMNGKTIEIKNTDAEGRLTLADALCYAEKYYEPDVMIDAATLTGSCLHALGHFYSALMTQDEELLEVLPELGKRTGDRVWPLPLDDDYKKANESLVADVANTGSRAYLAGSIIAGSFLSNFVDHTPWAHLDIAGTAFEVPGISYFGKGAAGAGVRLFTEFIMGYEN